ncbi:MAG: ferredoxin family protein [Bacteroidales bacterium]|nr:ferredoxin family protein [Bacteroidales bacterium]
MARFVGAIVVEDARCKGCGLCVDACPMHVLAMSEKLNRKGYPVAYMKNLSHCTGCANCGIICPDGAISVYKTKIA